MAPASTRTSSPGSVLVMDSASSSSSSGSRREEEEDPMLLSPEKKRRRTLDTRSRVDTTSSPRTTRQNATQQAGTVASLSPLKRSSPTKKLNVQPRLHPSASSSRTTRNSASSAKKQTPAPPTTTPSKRVKKEAPSPARPSSSSRARPPSSRRLSRSPSPASSTSPKKPSGWRGWALATEPEELHPSKGYNSGLEILQKQGLLEPDAQLKLRNGRTVVGKFSEKMKSGVGRWGYAEDDMEEKEGSVDAMEVDAELRVEKDEYDELDVERPPSMDEPQQQPPQLQASSSPQQLTLAPHLLAHLPKTKALVLAHLTGRVPPLPPVASNPPRPSDPKGKGKGKAVAPLPPSSEGSAEENAEGVNTLVELLRGTVERGEGNSCLIQGVKGGGKTTALNKALDTLIASASSPSTSILPPIIIRLSALIQTDDRAAIREIGRQVGAEGFDKDDAAEEGAEHEGDGGEPMEILQITTLPSHLLAILTAPSKKAIVIVLEEFDLFAGFGRGGRQMLLYCLLDVVQSIRPTLSATTLSSRGVAVVGLTSRIDTLHLLEKRVKSRFSHRIIRISSPMHGDRSSTVANIRHPVDGEMDLEEEEEDEPEPVPKWVGIVGSALVPWDEGGESEEGESEWKRTWREAVGKVLEDEEVKKGMERLSWMCSDVRQVSKIFIRPILDLTPVSPFLTPARIITSFVEQAEGTGWGKDMRKLAGLSPPALAVLASIKDLGERGITEFNFEHVFFTYSEFAKAKLVGSGKPRFSRGMMREAFHSLLSTSLIYPLSTSTTATSTLSTSGMDFVRHRCAAPAFDLVEFFRGEGGKGVMTQLSGWGRKWDV